jgi:hypothetical protein
MTRRAFSFAACVGLLVVLVVVVMAGVTPRLPSAEKDKLTPTGPPSLPVGMSGQVRGINASSPPKYEGCVCSLAFGDKTSNLVTKSVFIQNMLVWALTTHNTVTMGATNLSGPPAELGPAVGSNSWYTIQSVTCSTTQ